MTNAMDLRLKNQVILVNKYRVLHLSWIWIHFLRLLLNVVYGLY